MTEPRKGHGEGQGLLPGGVLLAHLEPLRRRLGQGRTAGGQQDPGEGQRKETAEIYRYHAILTNGEVAHRRALTIQSLWALANWKASRVARSSSNMPMTRS